MQSAGVVRSTQKSYLSKRKDIVLKYYFGKSEFHAYEQYLIDTKCT